MSIEVTLYPEKAKKKDLIIHLESLGYYKCDHLWNWPQGSEHFHWFQEKDYLSADGVEATVYPINEEEKYPDSTWALHTRTRASASSFDKNHQNETIKKARKLYGGRFNNDWYGKNRYTKIVLDKRPPQGRGIFNAYVHVKNSLEKLALALPKEYEYPKDDSLGIHRMVAQQQPTRVLFNALVPFLVSSIEHFFRQTFQILLRYDEKAKEKYESLHRKIEFSEVLKITNGEKTLEAHISNWYSFQNIDSINKAFKEWFDFDVWKAIKKRRKVKNSIVSLDKKITELIEFRHGVVHRYYMNLDLERKELEKLISTVSVLMDIFISELEAEMNILINTDTPYPLSD